MRTRRCLRRRLLTWLSFALLVGAATSGGDRALHAQAGQTPFVQDGTLILRASPEHIELIAARHGLTVVGRVSEQSDLFLVRRIESTFTGGGLISLSSTTEPEIPPDPQIANLEPNAIVVTPEVASGNELNHSTAEILDSLENRTLVEHFGQQVWYGYVNQSATGAVRMRDAHGVSTSGAGIVAIIDTGVDPNHPLLQGVLVPGYDFVNDTAGAASEWTDLDHSTAEILDHSTAEILDSSVGAVKLNASTVALLNSATTLDPEQLPPAFGHGTMVAGIIHLIAPTARIMPLKAFASDGTSRTFDIVRAIYYAADHGARVINMSFSAALPSVEVARAINYATERGAVVVASVGNLGQEVIVYPGGFRNVIGVASSTSASTPLRSVFSNYGDAVVSLAAPGEAIITTYPGGGYAAGWGTSFSAPLVAGGAALLLQIDPALNFQKAADQFAKAIPMAPGMGKGRLNLYEAVRTLPDTIAPTASLVSPTATGAISGEVLISASASDNVAVAGVQFLLNGRRLGSEDAAAPYELQWPTTTVANGAHVLTAIARDAAGNVATSNTTVLVSNDFHAPTLAVTAPAPGVFVSGAVTVAATATDDIGVAGVRFHLDGALVADDAEPPYEFSWDTGPVSDGPHTWLVTARDAAGKETSSSINVTVTHDVTGPAVGVIAPAAAATVSGTITIAASATDDVGVVSVQFLLDGMPLGTPVTTSPYEATWSALSVPNGTHTLTAVARDAVGHVTTANAITFAVLNDLASPTVGLVTPAAGDTVSGTATITATAADDVGVTSVQFLLDGAPLGAAVTMAPYQIEWPTTSATNAAHSLSAIAVDAAGRTATAAAVIVNVRNDLAAPTVVLSNPTAGAIVSGSITITATAVDDVGVTGVQFQLDGAPFGDVDAEAPYELAWPTLATANGAHVVTAIARDAAGRETTSEAVSVSVRNDLAAPTVMLTGPSAGTTVNGAITVTAAADDDIGVSSVQFFLNGAALGPVDTAAPFEVQWPTLTAANGDYTLTAVARDAFGRETTTEALTVTVLNDRAAPAVNLSSPAAGTTLNGTVTVTAAASDDVGVTSVQFLLDGAPLGAADSEAPYQATWPTLTATNAAHALTAVARDGAGRETTSEPVSVTVLNDVAAPTVAVTSPVADLTIGGTATLVATADDDIAVTSVQFLLDGVPVGEADTNAPYEIDWVTSTAVNGPHTVSAVARDAAGHVSTSSAVSVTVVNDLSAPAIGLSAPAAGATVNGAIVVSATASDDVGVTSVQFLLDGEPLGTAVTAAPYQVEWTTTGATNAAHTLSAVARDGAGRETTATPLIVNVRNDLAAPTVLVATPAAGATVQGEVTITATAVDDVGVTSVQFQIDGAPLGEADAAAPYEINWSTPAIANGSHVVTAVARDGAGRETTSEPATVTVLNDVAAPSVLLATPAADSTVQGEVTISATATDDVGVTSVQFLVDGAPVGGADVAAPYEINWSSLGVANGSHALAAIARDAAGRETTSASTTITVLNDVAAPSVAVTAPSADTTVNGTVTVSATATDDIGVASVQFLLDGAPLGAALTAAPYQVEWATTGATNAAHALSAVARDAAGRETTATAVTVNVRNDVAAPTVSMATPSAGATVSGSVTISAAASDDIGVTSVQFLVDGAPAGAADVAAPYEINWSTLSVANGSHALTAVARDAAGHETTSDATSINVLNDLAAPTVALTAPAVDATVGGTVTVAAAATDDIAVASVQFFVDGAPLGNADTDAPYETEWATTSAVNGVHSLSAVARDAAGHVTTANAINVTITNDVSAPVIGLKSPTAGATVDGTIVITATATDDVGVGSVQFLLDGAPLGNALTAPPYRFEWTTTGATNEAHTLSAVARDAAGRETTATAVIVNVLNDVAAPTVILAAPLAGATLQGEVNISATAADDVGVTSVQFFVDGAPLGDADSTAPYEISWSTVAVANGSHVVTAVARDGSGRETTSEATAVTVVNDAAAPAVTLIGPAADTTITGTVTIAASATDDIGVTSVQFFLDGAPLGVADTEAPYEAEWVTTSTVNGLHSLSALARDAAGRATTSNAINITVTNDVSAPAIGLTSPSSGATVDGTTTITATATDDVGVTSVQFMLDGAPLGAALTAAPYQIEWQTTAATNAAHTLTAVARDAAGRETTATAVIVNVRNDLAAPTVLIASPLAGATVQGDVTVNATAVDDVGVTSVQFFVDGSPLGEADVTAPYEINWSTIAVANGTHIVTAVARDAAGRETTSEPATIAVLNDAAAPSVAITNPTADATVTATITIGATAIDDVGVTSVQFLLDGAPLGEADTAAPYELEWLTTAVTNGAHTITAVARDAAGKQNTSSVTVVVANE